MKRMIYAFVLMLACNQVIAQQFSFEVFITDSLGHADTVTLGYDASATDSIDAQFGESNIVNQTWDSLFEARISPLTDWNGPVSNFSPPYQSKRQILHYNPQPPYSPFQSQYSNPVYIEVFSANGIPFSLHWNSTLFADSGRTRSGFNFIGIFNLPPVYASGNNILEFQGNYTDASYYLKNNDTIWLIGFAFCSYSTVGLNPSINNLNADITLYPNPSNGWINFKLNDNQHRIDKISIYDILSNEVFNTQESSSELNLNLSHLSAGIYMLHGHTSNGKRFVKKLIIN
jgi:hypothetical protein